MTGRGRREVMVGLGCWAAMLAVRAAALRGDGAGRARSNGERIVRLERRLGIHREPAVQRAFLRCPRLVAAANVSYVAANIGITLGWLVHLYRRDRVAYRAARRAVVGGTLAAQAAFLAFPAAPPRSLDHIVDSIHELSGFDLDGRMISRLYNPVAAMPSIHMTYAVVIAGSAAARTPRPALRRALAAYPPMVASVVVATGNHYLADVIAGSALGAASLWWSSGCQGRG